MTNPELIKWLTDQTKNFTDPRVLSWIHTKIGLLYAESSQSVKTPQEKFEVNERVSIKFKEDHRNYGYFCWDKNVTYSAIVLHDNNEYIDVIIGVSQYGLHKSLIEITKAPPSCPTCGRY